MGLQYVVAKRVFGFDKTKTEKYVAKSVGSGEVDFDKLCAKVSRIIGVHRKVVDLVAVGLVDIMTEEIDDGKTIALGDFGRFRPSFSGKSADKQEDVSASNIVRKRILFMPGKAFSRMLNNMSITRMAIPDADYTDSGKKSENTGSKPSESGENGQTGNPLG
ncbi:hypothetical protein EII33_13450 [Bacteroides heparinolyticus]|uniref:DNA-binding protein n=1 Tax=Prevotella heparinolytica TaxID=28113 RepID=A0A3P1ZYL6_9BACE|nr:HU family DNA-binding protein [Bacteroides heparinolyticus]RRD87200.1 hypothetical protein EII33_13450 [Bacteroides heparinolyticus]VFB13486.1 DNA-binding protein [Bacteroides heparinolyticus]